MILANMASICLLLWLNLANLTKWYLKVAKNMCSCAGFSTRQISNFIYICKQNSKIARFLYWVIIGF